MIDICITTTQVTMDKLKKFKLSPLGIFFYATVTGIIGIVILLIFLSMLISSSLLPAILPLIVSFNCAASGFSLRDKSPVASPLTFSPLGLATLLTISGCSAILLFCPWESLFDSSRYFITGTSGLVFTYFGVWIAIKSKGLNRSK